MAKWSFSVHGVTRRIRYFVLSQKPMILLLVMFQMILQNA